MLTTYHLLHVLRRSSVSSDATSHSHRLQYSYSADTTSHSISGSVDRSKPIPKSIERARRMKRSGGPGSHSSEGRGRGNSPQVFTFPASTATGRDQDSWSRRSQPQQDREQFVSPVEDMYPDMRSLGAASYQSSQARGVTPSQVEQDENAQLAHLKRQVEELQRSFLSGRASESARSFDQPHQDHAYSTSSVPRSRGGDSKPSGRSSKHRSTHRNFPSPSTSDSFAQLSGDIDVLKV